MLGHPVKLIDPEAPFNVNDSMLESSSVVGPPEMQYWEKEIEFIEITVTINSSFFIDFC